MVDGAPAAFVLVPLEHREVGDPEERERRLVDQAELAPEVQPQRAEHLRGRAPSRRRRRAASRPARRRAPRARRRRGTSRSASAARPSPRRGSGRRGPWRRAPSRAPRAPRARCARTSAARAGSARPRPARRRRTPSRASSSVASSSSSPKRVSGLSDAEAAVGLLERHPRPRRRDLDPEALAPDRREHRLHRREELLAIGEAHLGVELRDLLDAVGAEILVPEADRDLVVAVEAGDHRQLLEDLRALRQREEPPLVQPARHDEVARALRASA